MRARLFGAPAALVPDDPIYYADHMNVEYVLPVLAGLGFLLGLAIRYWIRRRRAARLADQLLHDVVKAKDAFRR